MVLPPELRDQGLYDASGCHLGGLYEPLMVDGQLTGALAVMRAALPAERLIWHNMACWNPQSDLGLLWAMPATPNPLAVTLGVLRTRRIFSCKLSAARITFHRSPPPTYPDARRSGSSMSTY